MKSFFVIILIILASCATSTSEIIKIRQHSQYKQLTSDERDLAEKIMNKADTSYRRDYYFSKLTHLLNTVTHPRDQISKMNRGEITRSINETKKERREIVSNTESDLEEHLSQEESYESSTERKWNTYKPYFAGPFFYVADSNPLDILAHINVRLRGDFSIVSKIILLEDAIEKHLKLPGYSVNLVFVGYSDDEGDVFDVNVNPNEWVSSYNWAGGHKVLAHELMHLMGLPDEYDRIEAHAGNPNMERLHRLQLFLIQMDDDTPIDAAQGIMCFHQFKPLERHACSSVGLSEECVKARMKAFH